MQNLPLVFIYFSLFVMSSMSIVFSIVQCVWVVSDVLGVVGIGSTLFLYGIHVFFKP
jgi:hypothetical protein